MLVDSMDGDVGSYLGPANVYRSWSWSLEGSDDVDNIMSSLSYIKSLQ